MRRFVFLAGLVIILILSSLSPAYSQENSSLRISVLHQYRVNGYGFAVLNETITLANDGTSAVQIPTLQVGIPDTIIARSATFINETSNQITLSSKKTNGSVVFTLSPSQPSLAANTVSKVSLKTYVKKIVSQNVTSTGPVEQLLVMITPSLNVEVNSMHMLIQLPSSTSLKPAPSGFSSGVNNSLPYYERIQNDFRPSEAVTETFEVEVGDFNSFQPIEVSSAVRTLTTSPDGVPQISDQLTVKNLGDVQINRLKLSLLSGEITSATVLSSVHPPLLNPTVINIPNGLIDLTKSPFKGNIPAGDTFTLTILYDLPAHFAKVSGSMVTVDIPYSPPIDGIVDNYIIRMSPQGGVISVSSNDVSLKGASPLLKGTATFQYTLSLGWAAQQAIPVASVLFVIVFIALFVRRGRPTQKEETVDTRGGSLSDMIKAFEEKIAILNQAVEEVTSKTPGVMGKKDFDEMRGKLDAARSRALQRLNETRTKASSKRLLGLTNQISEAEREENRSSKDMLNLYEQYYTRKMRKETFEKLLPSYRKRLDDATNHLSDFLNAAQKEGRQL